MLFELTSKRLSDQFIDKRICIGLGLAKLAGLNLGQAATRRGPGGDQVVHGDHRLNLLIVLTTGQGGGGGQQREGVRETETEKDRERER